MPEEKRGYSMPLAVHRWSRLITLGAWLFIVITGIATLFPEIREIVKREESEIIAFRFTAIVTTPWMLSIGAICLAQLHLVPEGIAVTVFGLTVRRIPAEEVRFLTGVCYRHKSTEEKLIAVSTRSRETLQEDAAPEPALGLHELWEGEWVGKYLLNRAEPFARDMNRNRWILWLDWDPERLKLLRKMYPQARWEDLTREKMFDSLLEEASSEHLR